MSRKTTIIRGTLVLTAVGFLCRFMGFFYRIFLSQTFGEESVGLYQLGFPIFTFCLALTCAGMETAISRMVARSLSLGKKEDARQTLCLGILVSCTVSVILLLFLQKNISYICRVILGDARCEMLLLILSYSLPFASLHCCIIGYCYGLKQTKIPAVSQLIEQISRILCVMLVYLYFTYRGENADISIASAGIVAGEILSTFYAVRTLQRQRVYLFHPLPSFRSLRRVSHTLLPLSLPLTANRVLINLLHGIEAVSIPGRLKLYSHSTSEALSIYGVLTGMALPCILFPSAITNSVSIMLMPTVAELQATASARRIRELLSKVLKSCFTLGLTCCLFFLLFGRLIGLLLFDSFLAGDFIITLSWICPFLYVNSSLISVINGLGKTSLTFLINSVSLLLRIISVFWAIPVFGIQGYLWGMLVSQLFVSLFSGVILKRILQ